MEVYFYTGTQTCQFQSHCERDMNNAFIKDVNSKVTVKGISVMHLSKM